MWRQVVAQSPSGNASASDVVRYDVGWKALNTMLRAGRSLSGHERNCCFLNTRGDRFADISAAADIDFDDDGRVLATVDWDFDGDLDFWIANRTGPQVRFLRNDHDNNHNYVAFKLQGKTCNRDAIGARVELFLKDDDHPLRSKTLRAGEGYLAQCSKWIHFGLGDKKAIEKVVVHWPDGKQEVFPEVIANSRYRLKQSEGRAMSWNPPLREVRLTAKKVEVPPPTDKSRVVLIAPIPIPEIEYTDKNGTPQRISSSNGRARLINLWATWCQPCIAELAEWVEHKQALASSGIEVLTINVDAPESDRKTQIEKIDELAKKLKLPFEGGYATESLLTQFDVMQRSIVRLQKPLPVPTSFLIDGRGNLRIIYKGPVSSEQLLADSKLLDASPKEIVDASIPYKGIWLGQPAGSSPNSIAVKFVEGGFFKEAEQYIRQLASRKVDNAMYKPGDAQVLLGAILSDQNRLEEAVLAFREALRVDPNHRQSHIELGRLLLELKRPAEAADHYEQALKNRSDDPELLFKLGVARSRQGRPDEAIAALRRSINLGPSVLAHHEIANILLGTRRFEKAIAELKLAYTVDPSFEPSANNLAWLLATQPDPALRDGKLAVQIAERLCGNNRQQDAGHFDTLAATYAETGNFAKAIQAAKQSISLATAANDAGKAQRVQGRLKLYEQKQPYRDR